MEDKTHLFYYCPVVASFWPQGAHGLAEQEIRSHLTHDSTTWGFQDDPNAIFNIVGKMYGLKSSQTLIMSSFVSFLNINIYSKRFFLMVKLEN